MLNKCVMLTHVSHRKAMPKLEVHRASRVSGAEDLIFSFDSYVVAVATDVQMATGYRCSLAWPV